MVISTFFLKFNLRQELSIQNELNLEECKTYYKYKAQISENSGFNSLPRLSNFRRFLFSNKNNEIDKFYECPAITLLIKQFFQ